MFNTFSHVTPLRVSVGLLQFGGHFRIVCGRSYNPLRCLADHLPEVIADEQATKGQP
jgi:hypothetical protein